MPDFFKKPKTKRVKPCLSSELSGLLAVLYALREFKEYEENYHKEQMEDENRWVTITHEMAMDACDPSMEGQKWYW